MNLKLTNLIVFIIIAVNGFSQEERRTILNGSVRNDSIFIRDIQIINLSTKFGSFSNENGQFEISAKLNDEILFKSLAYKDRTIKITNTHLKNKAIVVYLEPTIYELDEVFIEKLEFDIKNIAVHKNAQFDKDFIDRQKAPDARSLTDPTYNSGGVSVLGVVTELYKIIWKKKIEENKNKREKEKLEKDLQEKFMEDFQYRYDKKFFVDTLEISEDEYYRFLDYCEGKGLIKFYKSNEFEIKDFLFKQAKIFNEIKAK
jgi:hypothetical protein